MRTLPDSDAFFAEFFAQIPPEIGNTFTDEQLEAIKKAFGVPNWNRHPLDLRISVPIPGLRFYLVLLAGPQRRSRQRLREQKRVYYLWTANNIIFIIGFFIILSVSSFAILSLLFSSFAELYISSPNPTSIPWLENKFDCEHSGRSWKNGKCWDYEHNPIF